VKVNDFEDFILDRIEKLNNLLDSLNKNTKRDEPLINIVKRNILTNERLLKVTDLVNDENDTREVILIASK
jgi:hypothetical protein